MVNSKDLLAKISAHLEKTPESYTEIRLIVAKNIFIFVAVLYYSTWLFTVGGWQKEMMSRATFFFFILLTGASLWLIACLIEYAFQVYIPQYKKVIYGVWGILLLVFIGITALHLNLFHI
jgi:hypothetical protein